MHMCEEISSTESIRASKQKFTENPHLLIQLFTKFLLNKIHQLPPMSLMMMMMMMIKKIHFNTLRKLMYFRMHFLWNSAHDYRTNSHYHPQITFHLPPLKHESHLPITTPWYVNWPTFFTIPTSKSHSLPTITNITFYIIESIPPIHTYIVAFTNRNATYITCHI